MKATILCGSDPAMLSDKQMRMEDAGLGRVVVAQTDWTEKSAEKICERFSQDPLRFDRLALLVDEYKDIELAAFSEVLARCRRFADALAESLPDSSRDKLQEPCAAGEVLYLIIAAAQPTSDTSVFSSMLEANLSMSARDLAPKLRVNAIRLSPDVRTRAKRRASFEKALVYVSRQQALTGQSISI